MKARNHIFLILLFVEELKSVAMVQGWIDNARVAAPTNQRVQLNLDRKQLELDLKKDLIHETMFEICRSN